MMKEKLMRCALSLTAIAMIAIGGCDSAPTPVGTNGSVRGTVTDDAGGAVGNAAVALTGNGQAARTTNSAADGAYTFSDVPPGTYTLAVTPPAGFTLGATGTVSVTVASGAQANVPTLVLNAANTNGSIRGTITDNTGDAVANAAVALSGNGQVARTASSGVDGVYAFANVPPGTYTLAVTPPTGFTAGTTGTASVTVASGTQADAPPIVLYSCQVPQGLLRLDFFGGAATEADRGLFAYDVNAPLNLYRSLESTTNGVQRSAIAYTSPDGGTVTGLLFEPVDSPGLRPGVLYLQGFPGFASGAPTVAAAQQLAEYGAVVIVINIPAVRRAGPPVQFTSQDRAEQIQLIKDLQRAIDVLRAQPNVDHERIAFVGHSYGGAMGALFVGIERRIRAAVLMAADGGIVTHFMPNVSGLSCTARYAWLRDMTPIESIRYIPSAPPTALLLQNGHQDPATTPANATVLHEAAPEPKTVLWYDAGHSLNQQALFDRLDWLHEQIGLDPRS